MNQVSREVVNGFLVEAGVSGADGLWQVKYAGYGSNGDDLLLDGIATDKNGVVVESSIEEYRQSFIVDKSTVMKSKTAIDDIFLIEKSFIEKMTVAQMTVTQSYYGHSSPFVFKCSYFKIDNFRKYETRETFLYTSRLDITFSFIKNIFFQFILNLENDRDNEYKAFYVENVLEIPTNQTAHGSSVLVESNGVYYYHHSFDNLFLELKAK